MPAPALCSKWPQLIVFMDGLPRGATNKALRTNFAKRCSLPTLQLNTSALDSLFEARKPPPVRLLT